MRTILLDLCRERVDVLYKVLHWPTTRAAIEAAHAEPEGVPLSHSEQTLEYSLYYIVFCTLTDEEAKGLALGSRQDLLPQFQVATESLLARSCLLECADIPVLQAFIVYLVSFTLCWLECNARLDELRQ